ELTIPRARWDEGLALMDELLHEPAFPKKDLKRSQRDLRDWHTIQATNDLGTVASMARLHATYPPDHPRGTRPDLDALKSVKAGDLRTLHSRLLSQTPVTVEVFGDVSWEEVSADVTALLEGVGAAGERAVPPPFTPLSSAQIVAVDMPGQTQAAIRVTTEAPDRASVDRVPMSAVNFALGGSFTSRLNGNLREEKGWTYGSYSSYSSLPTHGAWSASVDVEAENVAAAIGEIKAELATIAADGPTAGEINAAWLDDVTWWNRRLETDSTAANFYQSLTRQEESIDDVAARLAAMHDLKPAAAQAVAARWLGVDAPMLWVIVGDRSAIGDQVESLGLPTTWISTTEAIMGTFTVPR
ncbi:MAG: zinc protease, partial [Myxococcota bacterium]